jgi:hypothetical protein
MHVRRDMDVMSGRRNQQEDQRDFGPSPTNGVRMQSLAKVELASPEGFHPDQPAGLALRAKPRRAGGYAALCYPDDMTDAGP